MYNCLFLKLAGNVNIVFYFLWFKQWNFNNIDKIVGCFLGSAVNKKKLKKMELSDKNLPY